MKKITQVDRTTRWLRMEQSSGNFFYSDEETIRSWANGTGCVLVTLCCAAVMIWASGIFG